MAGIAHAVLNYMKYAKKRYIELMSLSCSDALNPHNNLVTETIHPEIALGTRRYKIQEALFNVG